jgi:formylglycine-generating enzyme required for sulfatase activity
VKWPSHDEAFQNVVDRLREVVDDLEHRRHFQGALGVARYLARREAWVEAARAYAIALALHRDDFDPTKLVLEREQAECESEAPAPLVAPVLASAPPPDTTQAADDAYWEALADGDAAACAKYLERYPKGRHAAAARQRHEALTRAAQADDFVLVKGGTFQMGDVMGDKESTNETAHTVTLNDFYLARHALTFTEYDAFCEATGREKPGDEGWGRGKRPVINVSWYDAVEYCNWRSEQEGRQPAYEVDKSRKDANNKDENDALKWVVFFNSSANGYRLPTEAEWEYAAREGGKKVRFGNGRDVADPSEINFNASSEGKKAYSIAGEYRQRTVPVDEFPANALGLKQMSGNVLEWCWDWYGAKFYTESNGAGNPRGASAGASRVLRGGSFVDASQYCRTANRYAYQPTARRRSDGFRLASSL